MENSKTCKLHYNVYNVDIAYVYNVDIAYLHVYKVLKHFENIIELKHFKMQTTKYQECANKLHNLHNYVYYRTRTALK